MKQVILGTAGHIDHGKTSLIKALTNIDTDRLKEEKARGITIELGFAHLLLPSGQLLGIVDVPGHERFVKHMVAGATGVDLVAMVIAADEGIMPQTREHLEICQLLSVKHGLVVLTKRDMVDDDWIELVRDDVTQYLKGTFLEKAPIMEVSSVTGLGIEALIQLIDKMVAEIPERNSGNFFRLPVDRVFTMKGFGTVVTGTTASGSISVGDEVTIYPQELHSRIRGIQVHNKDAENVSAGLRTAINIQGMEKAQIERGNILAAKDTLKPTFMIDVELDLLASSPRPLKNRAKARFHAGTAEIISTVILLDRDVLNQGERCFAQIRLDEPTTVLRGDRYILRSYSPVRTIGGGRVLNPLPLKKKRFSEGVLADIELLNSGDPLVQIEQFVKMGRYTGKDAKEIQFLANLGKKKVDEALKVLSAQKRIIQYSKESGLFIHEEFLGDATKDFLTILSEYHERNPLKAGILKEELRSRTEGATNPRLFNFIVNQQSGLGIVVIENELLRLNDHRVTLANDQKEIRERIEDVYRRARLQPPYFKEVNSEFPDAKGADILGILIKEGLLVKVKEDLYFHKNAIDDLRERLIAFLKKNNEVNPTQFKDMTGTSRKYSIPLIEYFDHEQLTVRVGDNRILRKKI
ncbi:MAG: selenocysteine-specific translation elongation factor [Deltaproteobacteria bacterium]|nr:selenocysteine-specific translation elongation factor [Deltaproteobacteria bacterium]